MAVIDGASTVVGSSSASAEGFVIFHFSETASGSSSMTGAGGTLYIGSGTFLGTSSMEWDYIQDGASTMAGTSSMAGDGNVIKNGSSTMLGTSSMEQSTFLPIWGTSFASMNPLVVTAIRAITMGPKTFQWMQLLQRGDLSIFFCNGDGNFSPIVVVYSLYYVRPDGSRQPVGPQHKSPVLGGVGEFYVAGRAGESGQPGNWVIEWKYQRSTVHPLEVVEMPFQVLDAVLAQDPLDTLDRKVKFGWN